MSSLEQARIDAVAIGEGQLRLATRRGVPLVQSNELALHVAGTEGNVLGLLSRLGNRVGLVTALPDTPLGHRIRTEYQTAGIDLSRVRWCPDGRVGLYFVEQGSPPVPSRVHYDRADSSFARLGVEDVDWAYVESARLVHLSGITAALTDNLYGVVVEAAERARRNDQLLSFDVNHRSLLWDADSARRRLEPLVTGAAVLFCSRRDAALVFGIRGPGDQVAKDLAARYDVHTVIVSDGAGTVEVLADGQRLSRTPPTTTVVDRVGAGDALIGGFLHGVLQENPEDGLELGVAAAALALTRYGDQLHTSLRELRELAAATGAGPDIIR